MSLSLKSLRLLGVSEFAYFIVFERKAINGAAIARAFMIFPYPLISLPNRKIRGMATMIIVAPGFLMT